MTIMLGVLTLTCHVCGKRWRIGHDRRSNIIIKHDVCVVPCLWCLSFSVGRGTYSIEEIISWLEKQLIK